MSHRQPATRLKFTSREQIVTETVVNIMEVCTSSQDVNVLELLLLSPKAEGTEVFPQCQMNTRR